METRKFKFEIGNYVRIVANDSCSVNEIGDIGEIVQQLEQSDGTLNYQVSVIGREQESNWSYEEELEEAINATDCAFKAGEIVTNNDETFVGKFVGKLDECYYFEVIESKFGTYIPSLKNENRVAFSSIDHLTIVQ